MKCQTSLGAVWRRGEWRVKIMIFKEEIQEIRNANTSREENLDENHAFMINDHIFGSIVGTMRK